ncbi:MAG: SAM-dependent methyltransferase, partial [Anaerolineales bacterium]
ESFLINVKGLVCADVGSSTGGFTDCLLQHGALKVYAIDVGKGILHWKFRSDLRLVVREGTNVWRVEYLPEPVSLTTIVLLKTIQKNRPAGYFQAGRCMENLV